MPAKSSESVFVAEVASLVAFDLLSPPFAAGFREAEVLAVFMAVSETAVDEDDGAGFRQDEVGSAGEGSVFRAVDSETVANCEDFIPGLIR